MATKHSTTKGVLRFPGALRTNESGVRAFLGASGFPAGTGKARAVLPTTEGDVFAAALLMRLSLV